MTERRRRRCKSLPYLVLLTEILLAGARLPAQLTALGSAQLFQCNGPDVCEGNDHFGAAAAVGDFDGDGFADLAVGVPNEGVSGVVGAGMVEIFHGSSAGLPEAADQRFSQTTSGVPGASETNDHFGAALAAGDLDEDGFADLAIGVPDEDLGDTVDAGMVVVLFGSANGLSTAGALEYDQSNLPPRNFGCSGIGGESAEAGDRFGFALAIADPLGVSQLHQLLIGVPGEDGFLLGQQDAGQIDIVFFDDPVGEPRGRSCMKFQDDYAACSGSDGVEGGDSFGRAVALRLHPVSNPDPIAGAPFEETAAGVSNSGVVNTALECFQQNGPLAGGEESGDRFGGALVTGDFDDDGRQDLAIGVAGEALGSATETGAVAIVYADASDHLSTSGSQFFDQDDFQPDSGSGTGDHFGATLAAGDFDGDGRTDLAIGAPDDTVGSAAGAGVVNVLYSAGASGLNATGGQTFDQDFPAAIPSLAENGDSFGGALAAGDFDGNGVADLAVGVPREGGVDPEVGVVDVLYGLDRSTGAFGTVGFSATAITVNEGAAFAVVVARRVGGAVLAASVDHSRVAGSATPGTDFGYTAGTFTWTAGDLSTDVKIITMIDDTTDEPDETIVIRLGNPSAGLAVTASTVTVTILDDDPPGQLFVDGFETGNTSKWSSAVP